MNKDFLGLGVKFDDEMLNNAQKELDKMVDGLFGRVENVINGSVGFDRDAFYFNRPINDQHPYYVVHEDNKDIIIYNVVGMGKGDIEVTKDEDSNEKIGYIKIKGERKSDILNKVYKNFYNLAATFPYDKNKVKDINCEMKDGLLYITIFNKEPKEHKIEVKYQE